MYIWIRSLYCSLLQYYIDNINPIYDYYFSWEYLTEMWYEINLHRFSQFIVLLGSRNMQLSWTTWGHILRPLDPQLFDWPTENLLFATLCIKKNKDPKQIPEEPQLKPLPKMKTDHLKVPSDTVAQEDFNKF